MITVVNPASVLYRNKFYQEMKDGDCLRVVVSGRFRDTHWSYVHKDDYEIFLVKHKEGIRAFTKSSIRQVNEDGLATETPYNLWSHLEKVAREPIVFLCCDVQNITKLSYSKNKIKLDEIFDFNKLQKKRVKNELGSELELEGTGKEWPKKFKYIMGANDLVDDVGMDGSVARSGTEIRFAHPELPKWKFHAIKNIMKIAKDNGFSAGPSAGQHIHISHPSILKAIAKFEFSLDLMNEFLKPVSCRQNARYGLNNDLNRNQYVPFGTLEIRAWESTTNPILFRKRIIFAKMLVDYLVGDEPVEQIWTKMPIKMAKLYVDMLFTDNPNIFGEKPKEVLKKLSGWARRYAEKTYNQGE